MRLRSKEGEMGCLYRVETEKGMASMTWMRGELVGGARSVWRLISFGADFSYFPRSLLEGAPIDLFSVFRWMNYQSFAFLDVR
jgi:hypothetical protein